MPDGSPVDADYVAVIPLKKYGVGDWATVVGQAAAPHGQVYKFPSGQVDPSETKAVQTAHRELCEETGGFRAGGSPFFDPFVAIALSRAPYVTRVAFKRVGVITLKPLSTNVFRIMWSL